MDTDDYNRLASTRTWWGMDANDYYRLASTRIGWGMDTDEYNRLASTRTRWGIDKNYYKTPASTLGRIGNGYRSLSQASIHLGPDGEWLHIIATDPSFLVWIRLGMDIDHYNRLSSTWAGWGMDTDEYYRLASTPSRMEHGSRSFKQTSLHPGPGGNGYRSL